MTKSSMENQESIQNQALGLITSRVKSMPIESMLLLTNIKPLKTVFEEKATILYEKLLHLDDTFFGETTRIYLEILKPKWLCPESSCLQRYHHLPNIVDKALKPCNPLVIHEIRSRLNLQTSVLKNETAPEVLCLLALEMICNDLYPDLDWLRVYTDGSFSKDQPNTGAGIFCDLFSFYTPIGNFRTAFHGEVSAIRIAQKQLTTSTATSFKSSLTPDLLLRAFAPFATHPQGIHWISSSPSKSWN
ncbi:uncharacterized protein LOC129231131 [Uloborus diversus]|uniref:uncharacterized protein LOC129231131 n=1 Tax=Uloborus diversus TaxID=327109 RepID=UPI00240906D7|nr:uncharacterized protein LOC129231131 [Uloborus diversus]